VSIANLPFGKDSDACGNSFFNNETQAALQRRIKALFIDNIFNFR